MLGLFRKNTLKNEFKQIKDSVQTSFNNVKQDIEYISNNIKQLNVENSKINNEIICLKNEISSIREELKNIKNNSENINNFQLFKHPNSINIKQTTDYNNLNGVQTTVQTGFLSNLSYSEKAIIYVLAQQEDMKLSYEDLASHFGKTKATIRGQVNSIKQKNPGLILEKIGENNKKRIYLNEKFKEKIIKLKKNRTKSNNFEINDSFNDQIYE